MEIINLKSLKKEKVSTSLFTGKVTMQSPSIEPDEPDVTIAYVHFPKGVHNKFHKHSTDQILIVTEGRGFVATKTRTYEVNEGDIIWTPAGEIHKHGALPGYSFVHISITRSTSKLTQVEK